jgi:gamma-glutamyltranspeptidase
LWNRFAIGTGIRAGKVHIWLCVSNHRFPLPHREGIKQFHLVSALEKDDIHIGFGIMGGWNQAQAHAQFVANVVDYGMNVQAALEQARFTKGTFEGRDAQMENTISASVRDELIQRIRQPRCQLKSRAAVPLTCCGWTLSRVRGAAVLQLCQ